VRTGADRPLGLKERLAAEIAAAGPMDVAAYMARCLHDPLHGYYATRPALGEAGDFITGPLVSQMFGEIVGLWLAEVWRGLGAPERVILAEAGPGDGTLMSDALRAAKLAPSFLDACELWLIETSAPLRAIQAGRLAAAAPRWAGTLDELPDGAPLLLVANEFLDCLPARQFQRTPRGWAERMVGLARDGSLAFGLIPAAVCMPDAPLGAIVERSPAQEAFARALGARIAGAGGAALVVDYGAAEPSPGDTLQALRAHRRQDPLSAPGEADLTVHADFAAVLAAARAAGAEAGLVPQGEFLRRLGIEARAAALARARPDQAGLIARQLDRLTGEAQMGALFKAAAIWSGATPPGFEAP